MNPAAKLEAELSALRNGPEGETRALGTESVLTASIACAPGTTSDNSPDSGTALNSLPEWTSSTATTYDQTRRIREQQPPTDLVFSLTSLFFRHIHPWFPFLDIERVHADMSSGAMPSLLCHALFNISLPHSLDSRLDKASSDSYWKYSKRQIFFEVLEEPSYSSLEVLAILVLDLSGMTHGPQVWGALAVANRLATQLGGRGGGPALRASPGREVHGLLNRADNRFRQRLFWAIYALDCYITITTNHCSVLSYEQIQALLPMREDLWTDDYGEDVPLTPVTIFGRQLELLDLSRKLHAQAVAFFSSSDSSDATTCPVDAVSSSSADLDRWRQQLHPRLDLDGPQADHLQRAVRPAIFMLHGFYHGLVLYVGGFVAPSAQLLQTSECRLSLREDYLQRAWQSVDGLAQLINTMASHIPEKLGWPFAWAVWLGARFLIIQRCMQQHDQPRTNSILTLFVKFVGKMGQYWKISRVYCWLLKQGIEELESGRSQRPTSVISLLADTRVSTSQLEDHFRPDPMIRRACNDYEPDPPLVVTQSTPPEPLAEMFVGLSNEMIFDMMQPTGDIWFRNL